MRILGVDPGVMGGLAIYAAHFRTLHDAIDIPVVGEKAKRRVEVLAIAEWLKTADCAHAFIERAQAMPEQGASSGFLYGRAVGAIEAVVACAGIPVTIIEARAWKTFHNLIRSDKEASRQRALQLFPSAHKLLARHMDHGRAEAALMACYGWSLLKNGGADANPKPAQASLSLPARRSAVEV